MKSSESINELASALCNAQGQMGGAVKDSANPFFNVKLCRSNFGRLRLSSNRLPIMA